MGKTRGKETQQQAPFQFYDLKLAIFLRVFLNPCSFILVLRARIRLYVISFLDSRQIGQNTEKLKRP